MFHRSSNLKGVSISNNESIDIIAPHEDYSHNPAYRRVKIKKTESGAKSGGGSYTDADSDENQLYDDVKYIY